MADELFEVTFDDDLPGDGGTTDTGTTVKTTANTGGSDDPMLDLKSQLEQMNGQLSTANQNALRAGEVARDATQRAARLEADLKTTRTAAVDSRLDTVVSGISAADAEASRAEQAYSQAFEAGDGKAMAKAQRDMATAVAKKGRLEEAKDDLEEDRKNPTMRVAADEGGSDQQAHQQPGSTAAAIDPVEAFVKGRTAPTAAWARAHPDFVTDTAKNIKLTEAHWNAMGAGLAVDSPAYFAHIEKFVGIGPVTSDTTTKDTTTQQQTTQRRPGTTAAPVTPGGSAINGSGNRTSVYLTDGERKSATDGTLIWNYDDPSGKSRFKKGDVIGVQEMAKRKAKLAADGKYDPMAAVQQ